jgi:hypothetical protein
MWPSLAGTRPVVAGPSRSRRSSLSWRIPPGRRSWDTSSCTWTAFRAPPEQRRRPTPARCLASTAGAWASRSPRTSTAASPLSRDTSSQGDEPLRARLQEPAQASKAVQQGSACRTTRPDTSGADPGYPRPPALASEAAGWRGHQDRRRARGDGRECGDMNVLRLFGRCCWAGDQLGRARRLRRNPTAATERLACGSALSCDSHSAKVILS